MNRGASTTFRAAALDFDDMATWQHNPKRYGVWSNNRRPIILCNHEAIRSHFLEVDDSDPMKGRSGFEHQNNGGIEFFSPELNVEGKNTR